MAEYRRNLYAHSHQTHSNVELDAIEPHHRVITGDNKRNLAQFEEKALCGRWNSGIFDDAAPPCGRTCRAFGTDGSGRIHFCNFHEGTICDRHRIAFYMQCNAKTDVLHIRTVFCARIQGNQGAPRVHRARAQQQVNKGKKFFCTNLYEFCMFCEGILILLKNIL